MQTLASRATLALLVGVVGGQALYAAPHCTNADLNGVYGMVATGNILFAPGFPPPLIGPFARAGRVFADGHGNVSVANTASYNGVIITESYGGGYTVSSDCTIDFSLLVGLPLGPGGKLVPVPFEFIGALAEKGDSAAVVLCGLAQGVPCFPTPQPTGNVIRVILEREDVNQAQCANGDLSGAFQLDLSGNTVFGPTLLPSPPFPPIAPQPFARDGRLVFDGHGAFSGNTTVNYSGFVIHSESLSGTYAVSSDCNISISLSGGGAWSGTLTDRGAGADLIVDDPGVVIAGTLKKQKPGQGPE